MALKHSWTTHLFTDTQVGNATPFSMFLPLNILPTALHGSAMRFIIDGQADFLQAAHVTATGSAEAYSVIRPSPREHKSTIFVPAFASDTNVAKVSAQRSAFSASACRACAELMQRPVQWAL